MKFKILIIEDDKMVRDNTSELLSLSGYEIETAENGKIGVEKVKEFHPDLIVCDVMMPELDGYGVLYILSKNPKTAAIPFIFLTAKIEKADLRKGMNLGADDYITKPFDDMELLNAVEGRIKKYEIIKKEFSSDINGFNEFLDDVENSNPIHSLTKQRSPFHYKAKEYVFREADFANFLYFIDKGKVKTFKINEDTKEYIIDVFGPGDFLGYQPLIENRKYTDYASTIEDSYIYKIPKDDFLNLINGNQEIAIKFIKIISKNLSDKEQKLLQLAYDSVKKRIALYLKNSFKENGGKSINYSRSDLAHIVGTSKETLVRSLTSLKEDKAIDSDGHSITLLDESKLNQLIQWS